MSSGVNIKYYDNNTIKYNTYQFSGDELEEHKFILGPTISDDNRNYRVLYNWLHGQLTAPIIGWGTSYFLAAISVGRTIKRIYEHDYDCGWELY